MKQEGLEEEARDELIKAICIWERLIQEIPQSEHTPRAYYTSAVCYSQELGDYKKGIDYFERIVDNWPTYEYAWSAQYQTGRYYERLRDTGGIEETEANERIEQAYIGVIEYYPSSDFAADAALKLGKINHDRGDTEIGGIYYLMFLATAQPEDPRIEAVTDMLMSD
jgi:outer membrane protein assembly factor BamD (BamD/ComL family)